VAPRPLSTSLLLAILVAVAAPLAAFTTFVHDVVKRRITGEIAEFFLRNKADDVADKINLALRERGRDLRIWCAEPAAIAALRAPDDLQARAELVDVLDRLCLLKEVYELLVVVDLDGRAIAWNHHDAHQQPLTPTIQRRITGLDLYETDWFRVAKGGDYRLVDWHIDPLERSDAATPSADPQDYSVGFAGPVRDPATREIVGVWYSLMDWRSIQEEILDRVANSFTTLAPERGYRGGYAFLWKADANTIIGHSDRSLYGREVSGDVVHLPQLHAAVRADPNAMVLYDYPEGRSKRAAFRQTTPPPKGFGWIVGVGVEDDEMFAPARWLGVILIVGTSAILAGLVLGAVIVSRTVSRPLAALSAEADRIAQGELGARVAPAGPAETVALAHTFNRMAEDLSASRERLVRAEKEAAWREMARQVSHEIKNPLTPMKLSISLLERARREGSPEFDAIFRRSLDTIDRQIASLRQIASDFRAFAGAPQRRRGPVDVAAAMQEAAALYEASAAEKRVHLVRDGEPVRVSADREELVRAIVNLVDNAVSAAPEGSDIQLASRMNDGRVRISVRDDGPGVPAELRSKLFTPYFSTRTHGTGLGLAIVRRIAEDHGGSAYLDDGAPGTTMVIELPALSPEDSA